MNETTEQQKRIIWYNNPSVRFEIVKALRFKELQIIGEGISIRWLNAQHVKILDSIFSHLNIVDRKASLYRSLDSYNKIPLMTFNMHKRSEQYKQWGEERKDHVIGSDFGIDIDCKKGTWRDAINDAQYLKDLFDSYNVRYSFWMSGQHGFHFIIPYEDMPQSVKTLKNHQLIGFYKLLAEQLSKNAPNIDLSIYMPTRVLKCPYTIEKNGVVILPLNNEAWVALKGGALNLDPLEIIKKYKLGYRGLYFNGNPEGIKKFIELY